MLYVTESLAIPDWELSESFVRASGPGGQNVNKVATAVELRFQAASSPSLAPQVKTRLRRLAGRRWTLDGTIVLRADRHRTQALNRAEAREKLQALILAAASAPRCEGPPRGPEGGPQRGGRGELTAHAGRLPSSGRRTQFAEAGYSGRSFSASGVSVVVSSTVPSSIR